MFRKTVFQQAYESIRSYSFRAVVTIVIIALGITALVVVMTSIEGIKQGMAQSFSSLGANTFKIENRTTQIVFGGRGSRGQRFPVITFQEALAFQEKFSEYAPVSLSASATPVGKVKYGKNATNPNIQVVGTDHHYLQTARYSVASGRFFNEEDLSLARNAAVLGDDIVKKLFPYESPIGKFVNINGKLYRVVGVFEKMGSSGMAGLDRMAMIPITTLRNHYPGERSFTINVFAEQAPAMEFLIEEARGSFRLIRGLRPGQEENFSIEKSDLFVDQILEQSQVITLAAQVIALITLLGASVALLNVMLVSVSERSVEIGLRKALGAPSKSIQGQFLAEAVIICQIGGIFGIGLGILGGNVVSNLAFFGSFVIPWAWILIGIIACLVVGVLSGYYPAWKASRVDPILTLRNI
jgi:putative ABC transport system permease protein